MWRNLISLSLGFAACAALWRQSLISDRWDAEPITMSKVDLHDHERELRLGLDPGNRRLPHGASDARLAAVRTELTKRRGY